MTFNRIFDILYKEDSDCRGEDGRLRYILCGKYGMDKICAYLNGVDWSEPSIPLDLVKLKLDRVINELIFLTCVQKKSLINSTRVSSMLHRTSAKGGAAGAKVPKAKSGATNITVYKRL